MFWTLTYDFVIHTQISKQYSNHSGNKNIKIGNYDSVNMLYYICYVVSKESEKELKKLDHEEMKEETHQLELQEGYIQDEEYDESED